MPGQGTEYKSIEEVRLILYPRSAPILDLEKEDVLEFPPDRAGELPRPGPVAPRPWSQAHPEWGLWNTGPDSWGRWHPHPT